MDPSTMEYSPGIENSLINEKSPYLLLHARQPVHWQPWSDKAFENARLLNRPVFLSIGYSTCHWCHVMARESFEDQGVARLLNEGFICIKVDREERPDIDQIYMAACLMMTGSGGWPLTIIMTPDKKPFFAATYLPKQTRFGLIGLLDLLPKIHQRWVTDGPAIRSIGEEVTSLLQQTTEGRGVRLDSAMLDEGYRDLVQHFDSLYGGFGPPPKFPTTQHFFFLLGYWWRTGESDALRMVETTLQAMRMGGIYDHVGFGFHRYAVDAEWKTPHFEKMLYDQALIAMSFLEVFRATGNPWYANTVREIFTYVLRDLTDEDGGFYAAEDAESEGREGQYYLWTRSELYDALTSEQRVAFFQVFRDPQKGTGPFSPAQAIEGANTLSRRTLPPTDTEQREGTDNDNESMVTNALNTLYKVRERRPKPRRDTKILADWNGLLIAALARGGYILSNPEYLGAAEKAMDCILQQMRTDDGRLYHESIDGVARIRGFLDDYAAVVWGLIELYEGTFKEKYLSEALSLVEITSTYFRDPRRGGYYFTASDGEPLIIRRKEIHDGAYPSGNALMMCNLLRLARLTGRTDLEEEALSLVEITSTYFRDPRRGGYYFTASDGEPLIIRRKEIHDGAYPSGNALMMRNLLRLARLTGRTDLEEEAHVLWNGCSDGVENAPLGYTGLLAPAVEALGSVSLVIVGDPLAEDTRSMVDTIRNPNTPPIDVLIVPPGDSRLDIEQMAGFVRSLKMVDGHATAYLCTGFTCHHPTTSLSELLRLVQESRHIVSKP